MRQLATGRPCSTNDAAQRAPPCHAGGHRQPGNRLPNMSASAHLLRRSSASAVSLPTAACSCLCAALTTVKEPLRCLVTTGFTECLCLCPAGETAWKKELVDSARSQCSSGTGGASGASSAPEQAKPLLLEESAAPRMSSRRMSPRQHAAAGRCRRACCEAGLHFQRAFVVGWAQQRACALRSGQPRHAARESTAWPLSC